MDDWTTIWAFGDNHPRRGFAVAVSQREDQIRAKVRVSRLWGLIRTRRITVGYPGESIKSVLNRAAVEVPEGSFGTTQTL